MSRCITRDYLTRSKGPIDLDKIIQSFNEKQAQPPKKTSTTRTKFTLRSIPSVKSAIVTIGSTSKEVEVCMNGKRIGVVSREFADRCKVAKEIKSINLQGLGQFKYSIAYSFIMGRLIVLPDESEEEIRLAYNRIMNDLMYEP